MQNERPLNKIVSDSPKGYMSLEQFGEIFYQKLDECYAHLPSSN